MGDIVDLHGQPAHLEDNQEFVVDCARYAEGVLDEKVIRKKYRLADDTWERLGDDDKLVEAIEAEKLRRIRDGSTKRERAQMLVTKAPGILDSIMCDAGASPRHRVDAIKTLDGFAGNGAEAAPASDRFQIIINLGSDTLRFDKSKAVDVNDVDPNDIKTASQEVLVAIAARKRDDGDGEPL
jgi:hypothetical protein